MRRVRRRLWRLARAPFVGPLLGRLFTHMSFAMPVKRLRETPTLLAFYHPQPSYPTHIVIVPKRARRRLLDLETADADFYVDLFQTVQSLVRELGLEQGGYRLIANGGAYQEVAHLHFHLIGAEDVTHQKDAE
jgi:histidine triad (HIT) family protein